MLNYAGYSNSSKSCVGALLTDKNRRLIFFMVRALLHINVRLIINFPKKRKLNSVDTFCSFGVEISTNTLAQRNLLWID
jgi:hypothetical protein